MDRRQLLTRTVGLAGVSTIALAGCTRLLNRNPIKTVSTQGYVLVVTLREQPTITRLALRNSAGTVVSDVEVDPAATRAQLGLVSTVPVTNRVTSILPADEYELIATDESGTDHERSLTLKPEVSLDSIRSPTQFGQRPAGGTDLQYYGGLAVDLTNEGNLPVWLTSSRVTGDIPFPRPRPFNVSAQLNEPEGVGLDHYTTEVPDVVPDREALGTGRVTFVTQYPPAAIPSTQFENPYDDHTARVRREYLNTTHQGTLTVTVGQSDETLSKEITMELGGEVRRLSGLFVTVYVFTEVRVRST